MIHVGSQCTIDCVNYIQRGVVMNGRGSLFGGVV